MTAIPGNIHQPAYTVRADQSQGFGTVGYQGSIGWPGGKKILISMPTMEAHDSTLQEVLARLHLQNNGAQPCECTTGQHGVPFLSHIPTGSLIEHDLLPPAFIAQATYTTHLVKPLSCAMALLWLRAALPCCAAVLCLQQTPATSHTSISSQTQSTHCENRM